MITIRDLLSHFHVEAQFTHNPDKRTNEILKKYLKEESFSEKYPNLIIQSGELNAFTYNKKDYAINQWLEGFVRGENSYCQKLKVYAGPDVIFQREGDREVNNLVDKLIRPTLLRADSPLQEHFSLFHTPRRYHVHSYRIGKFLLIFGLHNLCTTNDEYENFVFDLSHKKNVQLEGLLDEDLENKPLHNLYPIKEINTWNDFTSSFQSVKFSTEEFLEYKRELSLYQDNLTSAS